jgi:hypothetical protein
MCALKSINQFISILAKPPMMNATVSPPQPMLEGSEVTLLCEADGGKPLPEIKWYRKCK